MSTWKQVSRWFWLVTGIFATFFVLVELWGPDGEALGITSRLFLTLGALIALIDFNLDNFGQ